ncbi:MAG: hypothetical protein ACI8QQ_001743 [Psychroserpens sp.]
MPKKKSRMYNLVFICIPLEKGTLIRVIIDWFQILFQNEINKIGFA